MSIPRSDADSPWKLILRDYFPEAITFFFPDTSQLINWQKPIEFLDTELQQITVEAKLGRRYADQLVKVWSKRGKEVILLLHVEVQAKPEANFGERMLIYNLRIFNLLHHPAISLAILLPEALKHDFWTELKAYEEERQMPYITSVEEIGFERGIQQGVQSERKRLVLTLVEQRFGEVASEVRVQIEALSLEQLEALAIALLTLTTISELEAWLAHPSL